MERCWVCGSYFELGLWGKFDRLMGGDAFLPLCPVCSVALGADKSLREKKDYLNRIGEGKKLSAIILEDELVEGADKFDVPMAGYLLSVLFILLIGSFLGKTFAKNNFPLFLVCLVILLVSILLLASISEWDGQKRYRFVYTAKKLGYKDEKMRK